ncbi:AlpA family transcriptional regulator [Nocardia sp. BMG111209]|uniref:helix-turn-helix transcriptional regulator n=1 Tax=Nocardia sp. BMG111209 TaxID=1160137 RepID=UPI000691E5A5|nr:helix-turn-helix domain-containing protein [Nocardia sp. BMG111209]
MNAQEADETWLTSQELADRLKVKVSTLDKWAHTGTGPTYIKPGRIRRYALSEIVAWEKALLAEAQLRRRFPSVAVRPAGRTV